MQGPRVLGIQGLKGFGFRGLGLGFNGGFGVLRVWGFRELGI